MRHPTVKPKIGIVGAGPGGLITARILSMRDSNITLFERERSVADRSQGGSLDIHADAGQLALRKACLMEKFQQIARYADQESRLYDKHGTLMHLDTDVTDKDRPEIDRGQLRDMLLESVPHDIIRWGSQVTKVTPLPDGRCSVELADSTVEIFDIVVGADGTWSKVRSVLSDFVPQYTGVLMVEFSISDVDRQYPDTAAMAGRGLTFALGDSRALIAHRDAGAKLSGYAGFLADANWFEQNRLDQMDEESARLRLCEEFAGWSEELMLWLQRSEGPLAPRAIYELPAGHRWQHREGITLVGDAAHVMSPFGGDGANLAMLDGANLAEALLEPNWREAVAQFEQTMCARAETPARSAAQAIRDVFSPIGLEHSLQWAHVQEHESRPASKSS